MKTWIDSAACRGEKQCRACRCDEKFQAALAQHFEMPPGWPDCPHGVTLDDLPEPIPGLPDWFYDRQGKCRACSSETCMLKRMSGCQRNARLKRPAMACAEGRWGPSHMLHAT